MHVIFCISQNYFTQKWLGAVKICLLFHVQDGDEEEEEIVLHNEVRVPAEPEAAVTSTQQTTILGN